MIPSITLKLSSLIERSTGSKNYSTKSTRTWQGLVMEDVETVRDELIRLNPDKEELINDTLISIYQLIASKIIGETLSNTFTMDTINKIQHQYKLAFISYLELNQQKLVLPEYLLK